MLISIDRETLGKISHQFLWSGNPDARAPGIKLPVQNGDAILCAGLFQRSGIRKTGKKLCFALRDIIDNVGNAANRIGSTAISPHQPAGAKLYPAEITRDDYCDINQIASLKNLKAGNARRA